MDYRYEEALERAKKGMPIDEVFPELKESDDERIRRDIVAAVEMYKDFSQWRKGEIYAYLEKQKDSPMPEDTVIFQKGVAEGRRLEREEQRPAEWSEEDEKMLASIIKCAENDFHIHGYQRTWLKSLRPQSKQEWSEEDKTMLERCISKMANIIPVPGKHGLTNMSFEKHTDEKLAAWLKSLPERLNLQPKQEWSEEDERKLLEIKCLISNYRTGNDEYELCSWIDKIKDRVQPQLKQEWSEEDKKRVVELKTFIAKCNGFNKENRKKAFDMIDALRPRPHWKPSEEQMEALMWQIKNTSEGSWQRRVSEDLYNDLQKLL